LETEYGNVVIDDVLWKNKIHSRKYNYDFKIPEIRTTITKEFIKKENRFKLYVGAATVLQPNEQVQIAAQFEPSLYAGIGYSFGKGHSVYYERDFAREDNRFTYKYEIGRWEAFSTFSTQYKYNQLGIKFYVFN
jgi:hypothetical protein